MRRFRLANLSRADGSSVSVFGDRLASWKPYVAELSAPTREKCAALVQQTKEVSLRIQSRCTKSNAEALVARMRETWSHRVERFRQIARDVNAQWKEGGVEALRQSAQESVGIWCARSRDHMINCPPRAWASYKKLLEERPLVGNGLTAGVIYGVGDAAAQKVEKWLGIESPGKHEYNTMRTARMMVFGVFVAGPLLAKWYPQLQKMTVAYRTQFEPINFGFWQMPFFNRKELVGPRERFVEVAVKVLVDNLFFQPPFLTIYFFAMGLLEGLPFAVAYEKTQRNFHAAWGAGVLLWIPMQSVNFSLVPTSLQALFVNVVNMVWKMSLSIFYHAQEFGKAIEMKCEDDVPVPSPVAYSSDVVPKSSDQVRVDKLSVVQNQVLELRREMEAMRLRQSAQAATIATLRRQLDEQTRAIRRSTETLMDLSHVVVDQIAHVEEPLVLMKHQMEEQGQWIKRHTEELERLRDALQRDSAHTGIVAEFHD